MKLELKDITLVCIDTIEPLRTVPAFEHTLNLCTFPHVKFFTNISEYPLKDVEIVPYHSIRSLEDYSRFCIRDLAACIDTPFCLIIQYDGYVVNPAAWTDEFLNYDYVGAVWWHIQNFVGNGGFSLRSKKLLSAGTELNISKYNPEDYNICITHRKFFEDKGCIFAPQSVANKFSVENIPYQGSFGFHSNTTKKTIIN
jgi:hypothetical protein